MWPTFSRSQDVCQLCGRMQWELCRRDTDIADSLVKGTLPEIGQGNLAKKHDIWVRFWRMLYCNLTWWRDSKQGCQRESEHRDKARGVVYDGSAKQFGNAGAQSDGRQKGQLYTMSGRFLLDPTCMGPTSRVYKQCTDDVNYVLLNRY